MSDAIPAAIARALAFVEAHGDALQRACGAALAGRGPRDAVAALLPPIDTADAAAVALGRLLALGIDRGPAVERAVAVLASDQADDGGWTLGDARSRDAAGARLAATAHVAGLLARTACARPAVLDAAGRLLGARFAPEHVAASGAAGLAGFAAFFANTGHELADAALQWCGRELERGVRSGAVGPLEAARVLLACDAGALPGARLDARDLARSLAAAQASDGSFGPRDGHAAARVEATLDALAAWRRLAPRVFEEPPLR